MEVELALGGFAVVLLQQQLADGVVNLQVVRLLGHDPLENGHRAIILAEVGVTQFNVYLMCGDEEDTLEKYKKEVLPKFGPRFAPPSLG